MTDERENRIPDLSYGLEIWDDTSFLASFVPTLGGAVSNHLSRISNERKFARVQDYLQILNSEISTLAKTISVDYVKTEEFEVLLEKSLQQIDLELSETKRATFAKFLAGATKIADETYEEKLRFLKIIEDLQTDHIKVIGAILESPDPNPGSTGSIMQTLRKRLPKFTKGRMRDLLEQLDDLRLTKMGGAQAMMTGHGAENLEGHMTDLGRRFVAFLKD